MLPRAWAIVPLSLVVVALSACAAAQPTADAPRPSRTATGPRSAPLDVWDGHFDARAAELGGAGGVVSWGVFGSGDDVAMVGLTDGTLAPGDHTVAVECAGPASVAVVLSPGPESGPATDAAVTADVRCPGGASLAITTDVAGLAVSVDSHGEPGAYLIATDVGTSSG